MKRFLLLALFALSAMPASAAEMLSVIHQPAELRAEPLVARSQVLQALPRYTPLEVVEQSGDYYKVKNFDGMVGYIHRALVGPANSLVITANRCNVRKGPGTDQQIVFKAERGDRFKALSREGDWIEVADDQGRSGWIWAALTWGY